MRNSLFVVLLAFGLLNYGISIQKNLQESDPEKVISSGLFGTGDSNQPIGIEINDPLRIQTLPKHQHHKDIHPESSDIQRQRIQQENQKVAETQQVFGDDKQKLIKESDRDRDYINNFNELLAWGMIAGSMFLVVILIKMCSQKRERRQMRRLFQPQSLRRTYPINQQVQNQVALHYAQPEIYFHQNQTITNPNLFQTKNLDERINQVERELNKLKEMKQQLLRQELNEKKIQFQQRKAEMINNEKKHAFEQTRKNNSWNVGYGPNFYGQSNQAYCATYQQPFQVKDIEPIRNRSNSIKTEVSQQPILSNEVKYRNGIPVGKPVKQQDNNSSFASQYPSL